ncbi:MAG TPA: hypothetical protein VFF03_13100 [Rhodocyclaceae bacterium]|nr:hypothetical protein [Rhodocyclaceae bacterium]
MPRDPRQHSPSHAPVPREGDRRQANVLRRVPLSGGLGLVFNDRRSYRERRRTRHDSALPPPCALLQHRDSQAPRGFLGQVSAWTRTALGGWILRRLSQPWRARTRPPAGRP